MQTDETKIALSVINLPTKRALFRPKRLSLENDFHLIQARCEGQIKQGSYVKGQIYDKELLHVQQVAFETAVREGNAPLLPFICEVGKDRCLVQSNEKTQPSIDQVMGKSYSALVVVWEGRGYPPDELDAHLEDEPVSGEPVGEEGLTWDEDLDTIMTHRRNTNARWQRFGHEMDLNKVQQSWVKAGKAPAPVHHTGLRFRWTRVELYPYTEKFDTWNHMQRWTDELQGVDVSKLQLYHVKVGMKEIAKATLPQLIYQVVDNTHMNERSFTLHMIRALLGMEYKDQNVVLHTKKFYDMAKDKSWNVRDVQLVQGIVRELKLQGEDRVLLEQGTCYKLFMYNGLASDLLLGYFGAPATKGNTTYQDNITKVLRGRVVKVRGSGEKSIVFAISEHNARNVPDADKHEAWRRKSHQSLEHPELLCLDLGSQGSPALIPPELCVIAPNQSFTGKQSPGLRWDLSRLREDLNLPDCIEVGEDAHIEEFSPRQRDITALDKELADAFPNGVNFLFVDAGVSKLTNTTWDTFHDALQKNNIFRRRDMKGPAEQPIFLEYQPAATEGDMLATKERWRAQLQRAVKQLIARVPAVDKKPATIVIASVQDDQHNRDIYHMLKFVTDCEVGVQSYTVNVANVNRLAKQYRKDGGIKVANEVLKRMRIRNPYQQSPGDNKDIAVALHIERQLVDMPVLTNEDPYEPPRWVYLVILTSRGFETATDYHTKVHRLMSQSEIDDFNPAGHVLDFVKRALPNNSGDFEQRITILRSGYMPLTSPASEARRMPGMRIAKKHEHVHVESYHVQLGEVTKDAAPKKQGKKKEGEQDQKSEPQKSFNYFDHSSGDVSLKQNSAPPIDGSRAALANNEMGDIYTKLLDDSRTRKAKLSYLLLSEENDFRLTQQAKERIAKRCQDSVEDKDNGKGGRRAKAVFFVADKKLMPHDHTVGVHRNAASGNATMVKVELLGEKLSEEVDPPKRSDTDEALRVKEAAELENQKMAADYEQWKKMLQEHSRHQATQTPGQRKASLPSSPPFNGRTSPNPGTTRFGGKKHGPFNILGDSEKSSNATQRRTSGGPASMPSSTDSPLTRRSLSGGGIIESARRSPLSEKSPNSPSPKPLRHDVGSPQTPTRAPPATGLAISNLDDKENIDPSTTKQKDATQQGDGHVTEKKTAITDEELRRLAQLWKDDRMEMYNTKWPVPTHLAHLAAKRAWMHLRKNEWEDDEDGAAPLALTAVKEEVEKSLYYL